MKKRILWVSVMFAGLVSARPTVAQEVSITHSSFITLCEILGIIHSTCIDTIYDPDEETYRHDASCSLGINRGFFIQTLVDVQQQFLLPGSDFSKVRTIDWPLTESGQYCVENAGRFLTRDCLIFPTLGCSAPEYYPEEDLNVTAVACATFSVGAPL